MIQQLEQQKTTTVQHSPKSGRSAGGFVKLLGASSLVMAVLLPIGIYPRIMQANALEKAQKTNMEAPEVSVIKATPAESLKKMSLPGSIEAILDTSIYARTNGYVHQRYVDIGDRVKAGQLLAEIETPEVDESTYEAQALVLTSQATKAQAQAALDKMEADLHTAEADLAQAKAALIQSQSNEKFADTSTRRWAILAAQGAVSYQDADEKDTNYSTAKAGTLAAQERVKAAISQVVASRAQITAQKANIAASQANVDAAKSRARNQNTQKRFQEVRAPFDGVITERNIDQGSLISSGSDNSRTSLFKLARIDTLKVYIDAPQFVSNGISVGQHVNVTLKEFPGQTFEGTVARTSVALDSFARTLKVEVHIPNAQLKLAPGMYADVAFTSKRPANTYEIPVSALISRGEGEQVAVLRNGSVHYEKVQTGDDLGKSVEVITGLNGTESIINNPSDAMQEGAHVIAAK